MKIKIEHPALVRAVGIAGAAIVKRWMSTINFLYRYNDPAMNPAIAARTGQRYIYAFYHEILLIPAYLWAWPEMRMLISEHRDGELITQVARRLGAGVVRGSTTRGGSRVLTEMIDRVHTGHFGITPDGPRGPRRHVHQGLVFLASKTGLPIAAGGFAFKDAWRARSWDRFAVPKPYTIATGVSTRPIFVPRDANRATLEDYRREVERQMKEATAEAEDWAASV